MFSPDTADDLAADPLRLRLARGIAFAAGQYGTASVPMNSTWPGMGVSMAQGAWLYPPDTFSNEFSVLS